MVKLTKIYTRGGDKGQTSLVNGQRYDKDHPRIEAYGSVDEVNATIGIARLHCPNTCENAEIHSHKMLEMIQHDLFDLGADLATPYQENEGDMPALRIVEEQVTRLEHEIDAMNMHLSPLTSFVLPGGSPSSSYLHLARTICRRAERDVIKAARENDINPLAICYLNRLSDHLFVLGRYLNDFGKADILWVAGQNRSKSEEKNTN